MRRITIEWCGESYEFVPSHDLYMRIEDKVAFNRLAAMFEKAANDDGSLDMPMSHVSWVIYCVLKHCNVPVRTPMDIHPALFGGGSLPNSGEVIGELIAAYYGAMPERVAKKKPQQAERQRAPKKKSRKRRNRQSRR